MKIKEKVGAILWKRIFIAIVTLVIASSCLIAEAKKFPVTIIRRIIKDTYFDNLDETSEECNSIDVTLVLEDGSIYTLSIYKNGMLG